MLGFAAVDGSYPGWLYVHPEYYGQGIGRRLLRASLGLVSGEPWTIALAGNKPAIHLYRSEDFREVERFESDNAGYLCTCFGWSVCFPEMRMLAAGTQLALQTDPAVPGA